MRHGSRCLGGSYLYEGDRLETDWHSHDMHQIEYAINGVLEVETASAHHLLPPQQAAWSPAGAEHAITINSAVRTVTVMFDPLLIPQPGDQARVLAVPPVLREMMIYALRWPIARAEPDAVSDNFFATFAHIVSEALNHEAPLSLPTSTDPLVAAAMAYTQNNLASITVGEVSRAVGVSERTLRRQFTSMVGMPWRHYLHQARLLRAMVLLARPGQSVLRVSVAVGFDNVHAFARAFAQYCGESPSAYLRRVNTEPEPLTLSPSSHSRASGRELGTSAPGARVRFR